MFFEVNRNIFGITAGNDMRMVLAISKTCSFSNAIYSANE